MGDCIRGQSQFPLLDQYCIKGEYIWMTEDQYLHLLNTDPSIQEYLDNILKETIN